MTSKTGDLAQGLTAKKRFYCTIFTQEPAVSRRQWRWARRPTITSRRLLSLNMDKTPVMLVTRVDLRLTSRITLKVRNVMCKISTRLLQILIGSNRRAANELSNYLHYLVKHTWFEVFRNETKLANNANIGIRGFTMWTQKIPVTKCYPSEYWTTEPLITSPTCSSLH